MDRLKKTFAPRIYYLHPVMAGPISAWPAHADRCSQMGFDHLACAPLFAPGSSGDIFLAGNHEALHPALRSTGPADEGIAALAEICHGRGLTLMMDIVLDRVAADGQLATAVPSWFHGPAALEPERIDPRSTLRRADAAYARFDNPAATYQLVTWWTDRLTRLLEAGVGGFLCHHPQKLPPETWRSIIGVARRTTPGCRFLAWTSGVEWPRIADLNGVGFDGAFSSLPWWDEHASWFFAEHKLLRAIGSVIACPEAPFGMRLARRVATGGDLATTYRHRLRLAASTGDGLLIPMGFEIASAQDMHRCHSAPEDFTQAQSTDSIDLADDVRAANALADRLAALGLRGEMRSVTGPGSPVTAILRADEADIRFAQTAVVALINADLSREQRVPVPLNPLPPTAGASFDDAVSLETNRNPDVDLAAGEIRLVRMQRTKPVTQRPKDARLAKFVQANARVAIENVSPAVDGGRFAAKCVVGEAVAVEADVFMDGHDVLAVELLWRAADEEEWHRLRMQPLGNDRWRGTIRPTRVGRHVFTIEAWRDEYATFCHDIEAKRRAGDDVGLEIEEGRRLLDHTRTRASGSERATLTAALSALGTGPPQSRVDVLLAPDLRAAMDTCDERPFRHRQEPAFTIEMDRPQACFGSWYELFPRSATDDPGRHGTFDDVIRRLPAIRDMGFDVLYFPPIHPIGATNRKGRNNSIRAEPSDVGSPYAIGSSDGAHDAIHRALGTIEDFRRLRDAAMAHGLEIALDFAVQCSPDHPWLKEHRDWFRWRPDGSVRFAENPPKKYQDIVNPDFYAAEAIPNLWTSLREVVLYWVSEGIRTFRVDNPHTKPLPFWEWLIASVRARNADVIFLSEAFTRPKMMYRLAKVGFSQSYTYFTWRNAKQELTDYLTELTTTEIRHYFRPHFFVNTPDINPYFLQTSGRPGFLIRAALAATLSGLWGMYSGFELCEATPLPGREEYLDSEKYEIRARRHDVAGNIIGEITKLNRIRRANPALQSHLGLRFYNAFNDQVIYYGKSLPAGDDLILVAVSLDPHRVQEATIEVPLWEWGLPDASTVAVEDLMREHRFTWHGKLQRVRFDPSELPFAIWRIAPQQAG